MKKQIMKWSRRELLSDLFYDILGSILYGIGIYTFALNAGFATGGVSGMSLIINYLTKLPLGMVSLLLNIPMIILSFKVLGRRFLVKSVKTIIINSLFLDLLFPHIPTYYGEPFLACIFSGVFVGAACALLYTRGSSTGGVDFIILSLKKFFPYLTVGQITLIIDSIIVVLGGFVFRNIDAVLFGVIQIFVSTIVLDWMMSGSGSGKLAIIVTIDAMKTAKVISDAVDRGSTMLKGVGTYSGREREVLLCVCSREQIYKLRKAVHSIDENAMIMITDASEIFGEGFKIPEAE